MTLLDKLSGYAKPEERILIFTARYHHMRPASLEKAATRWPKLQIDFMTIHASKGQQADYVIIVGLQEEVMVFRSCGAGVDYGRGATATG